MDNRFIYERMIEEIDAINKRADERHAQIVAMFEDMGKTIITIEESLVIKEDL